MIAPSRRADLDVVAVDDAEDADTGDVPKAVDRRKLADLEPRRRGDRLRDRMLGRGLDGAGEAQDLGPQSRRRAASTSTSSILPSVIVPVLSSTIVPIFRVCSRISGPLMRMPSCAPRPVPTMSAVGVASPSAHGHAMMSTATAAVNALRGRGAEQRASRRASRARSRSRPGTNTAETRSASRCTGAFPDCAASTSRAICASAVSAPTFVARTTRRPYVLIVAPATSDPGPTSTGNGLAGQQRLVERRLALHDDAVGRDLLPGPDDDQVADDDLLDRDGDLVAVSQDARLLRSELEQHADRLARAALRARLEVAAEQDQRRDHRGDLEVRVRVEPADEHDRRPEARRRACRSRSACPSSPRDGARSASAARWKPDAAPEDDGCREDERDPLPARELQRRDHGERRERRGERDGDDEAPREERPIGSSWW